MDRHEDLRWDADLRLFSGAMMLRWTAAVAVTLLVMALIMGVALVPGEGWKVFFRMLPLFAAVAGGLWLLGVLVMAVVFRGRYAVRYTLSDTGIRLETRSKAAKFANRAVVVAGVLAGKPGAVGSGLIAQSQETQEVRWGGPLRVEASDADHVVTLRGPWRPLMVVQCTAGNYRDVLARVRAGVEGRRKDPASAARKSPLPRYLLRTAGVAIACVPLFAVADEYRLDLFVPILVLCFALATVWMVPILGWVVLCGLALFAGQLVMALSGTRTSFFRPGTSYRAYEMLSGDDWALLALFAAGAAWLAWLSISGLRGRIRSAFAADMDDMDGA